VKRSKLKSKGRAGKHGKLNGSTLRLFDRISNGLGRSYLDHQRLRNQMSRVGGVSYNG
jgi:hypothetical protein